jgi:hypothetical protein
VPAVLLDSSRYTDVEDNRDDQGNPLYTTAIRAS